MDWDDFICVAVPFGLLAAFLGFFAYAAHEGGKMIQVQKDECRALGGEWLASDVTLCIKPGAIIPLTPLKR